MKRVISMLVLAAIAGCEDSGTEVPQTVSLAGEWVIVDSSYNRYISAFDGTPRVRAWVNALTITVTATSDTSYDFETVTGTQVTIDSVSGQGFPPGGGSLNGLYGTIRIRGDTAYVTYLGQLDLQLLSGGTIAFTRNFPQAECLDQLGTLAQASPAPLCRTKHHWTSQ